MSSAPPFSVTPEVSSEVIHQRVIERAVDLQGRSGVWEHEPQLLMLLFGGALVLVLRAVTLAAIERRRSPRGLETGLLDVGAVLAWSLVVRWGLTTPNLLTDGGSGYGRLLRVQDLYGGLAMLVQLILPSERSALMWSAISVPTSFGALCAPLLTLLCRAMGLGRAVALWCGLALASHPLQAALHASDLLIGAMTAFQLGGLALVVHGARRERVPMLSAGLAVLGYGVWIRPEGGVIALSAGVAALSLVWRLWKRPEVMAAITGFSLTIGLRGYALVSNPRSQPGVFHGIHFFEDMPWHEWGASTALLPWWLWLPIPVGAVVVVSRRMATVVVTLCAMAVPILLRVTEQDPTGSFLELVRYGMPMLPWWLIVAGLGWERVITWIRPIVARSLSPAGTRRLTHALWACALVGVSVTPLVHTDYLATEYGHRPTQRAFAEALRRLPAECELVVPSDGDDGGSIEVFAQYGQVAEELRALGSRAADDLALVPLADFLKRAPEASDRCTYFFEGPFCFHGMSGKPPADCLQIRRAYDLESRGSWPVDFRNHRLVSGPWIRTAPWYVNGMRLGLFQVHARPPSAVP